MRLYASLLLLSAVGVAWSTKLSPPDWPEDDYEDKDSCWYDLPSAEGKRGLSCQHYEKTIGKGATECIYKAVAPIVTKYVNADRHNAAHLLRMHFHDCFVNGCDASLLLKASYDQKTGASERESPPNLTVEGYEVMDEIKAAVDEQCDPEVSCADLLAIGAMISVALVGGPSWGVPLGRLDGCVSQSSAAPIHLPSGQATVKKAQGGAPQSLAGNFKHVGLDLNDLVALSGAHTLGHVHCPNIQDRFNYANFRSPEPIDKELQQKLYKCCVNNHPSECKGDFPNKDILETPEVDLERGTPKQAITYPPRGGDKLFDNSYYKNLVQKMGILTSDQALYSDEHTRDLVLAYAKDEGFFFEHFIKSMIRMGSILPENMGVAPGAGVPVCGNRGEPVCLAYPRNVYGIRKGSCSKAGRECQAIGIAPMSGEHTKAPTKYKSEYTKGKYIKKSKQDKKGRHIKKGKHIEKSKHTKKSKPKAIRSKVKVKLGSLAKKRKEHKKSRRHHDGHRKHKLTKGIKGWRNRRTLEKEDEEEEEL